MSAMADMSKAMRRVLEDYSPYKERVALRDLDQDVLVQFATIVQAFGADLHDELTRRREQVPA